MNNTSVTNPKSTSSSEHTVTLLDQTLREGEQQAGVRFSPNHRTRLVNLLEDFGHTIIEVGHPGISEDDEEICRLTAEATNTAHTLMHARACPTEVQAAARAGADWVGIWASSNDVSMATKFSSWTPQQVHDRVAAAITEAVALGLKVRFTIEDASRTPWESLEKLATVAQQAGAARLSLADTTGCWHPTQCSAAVRRAKTQFELPLEVHLHNDLGLAHANALAAIDAGVDVVDVSILGIGERTGIVNSLELTTSLRKFSGNEQFDLSMIPVLQQEVSIATGHWPDALRPIVGANAFTHTSAYHVAAVDQDPHAYESVPPKLVGRDRVIIRERTPVPDRSIQVGQPFAKGAAELRHHRNGPGVRWVMLDSRVDDRTSFYVIQRHVAISSDGPAPDKHVDTHAHHCDSAFLFWGDSEDGTGLECEVQLDDQSVTVHSPASVFIPAGVPHSYYCVSGNGTYTNIVLAPEYNGSLLN